jgi:protein SCO1/2
MTRPTKRLAQCTAALLLVFSSSTPALADAEPGQHNVSPIADVRVEEHIGRRVPLDLPFTASDGTRRALGAWIGRGRPALLVLAYSRCAMLCNLVLRGTADGLRGSRLRPGEDFDVVTVSIDPHETLAQAAHVRQAALSRAGYDEQAPWQFLTGAQPDIERLADAVGFRYHWDEASKQFAHPAVVFVLSEKGEVIRYLYGLRWTPAELERALQPGTADTQAVTTPVSSVIACLRPSSIGGKYGSLIAQSFRIGAALVLVAVSLLLARLATREGRSP